MQGWHKNGSVQGPRAAAVTVVAAACSTTTTVAAPSGSRRWGWKVWEQPLPVWPGVSKKAEPQTCLSVRPVRMFADQGRGSSLPLFFMGERAKWARSFGHPVAPAVWGPSWQELVQLL